MANPNIVNVQDIRGKTALQSVTSSVSTIVSNQLSSNKIIKINNLIITNIDEEDPHKITVDFFRDTTPIRIAYQISVPVNASLIIISKDNSIYLEEGDSLRLTGNGENFSDNDLEAICSYEEIS